MFKKWIGDNYRCINYVPRFLESQGLDPHTHPFECLLVLDNIMLSGRNYTQDDEDSIVERYNQ